MKAASVGMRCAMHCHLVLDPQSKGWIIEKMCHHLGSQLQYFGHQVSIGEEPHRSADINHFMMFYRIPKVIPNRSTVAITHIDDSQRLDQARRAVLAAEMGICMSSMTVKQLVNGGVSREKLCYVLPAFDGGIQPRRIIIGLTTKLYSDGRKREALLVRLAGEMDLSQFHFEIFGTGWDKLAPLLREAGALVSVAADGNDAQADYQQIRERIPHFDYYLYLGLDEGSLGTLDALGAGVKTIVTPQGFHVDLPHGITHPFWTYDELRAVFESILEERAARVRAVAGLTWRRYAERHHFIWQTMLEGRADNLPGLLGQTSLAPLGGYAEGIDQHLASERRRLWFRSLLRYKATALKQTTKRFLKKVLPRRMTASLSRTNRANDR